MEIAFLGDSITYGYSLPNPETERWSYLVSQELNVREKNLGICGTLMARANMNRLPDDRSFVERVDLMKGSDCGIIFGGTNDYFWTDSLLEAPENSRETDSLVYFRPAVSYIFDRAVEMFGAKKTLVITPYSHHGWGNFRHGENANTPRFHDTDAPNYCGYCLEDYCDVLKEEAEKRGMLLLDLFSIYGRHSAGFDWQKLTFDGCHPNIEGHRVIADHVLRAIASWR